MDPGSSNPVSNPNSSSNQSTLHKRKPKMHESNKPPGFSGVHKQAQSSQSQQHHHHHGPSGEDSKFYIMSSIEPKDPLEIQLEESFNKLKSLIFPSQSQAESNIVNELCNYSNQSKLHFDELSNAILYSCLVDVSNSARCLRYLFLCNNLSFNFGPENPAYINFVTNINNILTESYLKMQDVPRQQIVWLLKELVKAKVTLSEKIVTTMLRNIQTACLTEKNIWLTESMLDILWESTTVPGATSADPPTSCLWIYAHNELMTQSVYTYLRVIADHSQMPSLTQLRQRESEFCIQVLRERWNECTLIGRDLIRVLQNVARLPEFEAFWRDLTQSPATFSAQFAQVGGLSYILKLPTRRRCLISRLTYDMERKVYFIITNVKAGQQKRYQVIKIHFYSNKSLFNRVLSFLTVLRQVALSLSCFLLSLEGPLKEYFRGSFGRHPQYISDCIDFS